MVYTFDISNFIYYLNKQNARIRRWVAKIYAIENLNFWQSSIPFSYLVLLNCPPKVHADATLDYSRNFPD